MLRLRVVFLNFQVSYPKMREFYQFCRKEELQEWNCNKNEGSMKPRGPKEAGLVAATGARSIAGCAQPCLETRSRAQSGA